MRSAKGKRVWGVLASAGVSLACLITAPCARADMLDITATVYKSSAATYEIDAPGPGTVWVSVSDIGWPEPFQSLSTSIQSSHSTLASASGSAMFDLDVGQASVLYAYIAGVTGSTLGLNVGMYSLHVGFTPAGQPVPLPEALRLLVVGLGLIGTVRLLWARAHTGWSVVGQPNLAQ